MQEKDARHLLLYFVLANALVLGTLGYAGVLEVRFPDFYFQSIQEDEYIEWATVWAFLLAGVAAFVLAARFRAATARFPWYFYGLGLFCVLVAMEEFSWGQRVIGYRPPVYFLENNFQQELNIHNVIDTGIRKLVLSLAILGYGVALPLLGWCSRRLAAGSGALASQRRPQRSSRHLPPPGCFTNFTPGATAASGSS